MVDTLLLSSSLHFTQLNFTPLHYTCRHFTSSHLNLTHIHFTTLSFGLTPFKFPTSPFHLTSLHFTTLHFTALLDDFRHTSHCKIQGGTNGLMEGMISGMTDTTLTDRKTDTVIQINVSWFTFCYGFFPAV